MAQPRRRVRVQLAHTVEYPNPIQVVAGAKVSVGREDDEYPGWKWCQAADGRAGWVPIELLSGAMMLQDYSARELAVQPGEEVEVEDERHGWLLVRNARGERGWIPASCASTTLSPQRDV